MDEGSDWTDNGALHRQGQRRRTDYENIDMFQFSVTPNSASGMSGSTDSKQISSCSNVFQSPPESGGCTNSGHKVPVCAASKDTTEGTPAVTERVPENFPQRSFGKDISEKSTTDNGGDGNDENPQGAKEVSITEVKEGKQNSNGRLSVAELAKQLDQSRLVRPSDVFPAQPGLLAEDGTTNSSKSILSQGNNIDSIVQHEEGEKSKVHVDHSMNKSPSVGQNSDNVFEEATAHDISEVQPRAKHSYENISLPPYESQSENIADNSRQSQTLSRQRRSHYENVVIDGDMLFSNVPANTKSEPPDGGNVDPNESDSSESTDSDDSYFTESDFEDSDLENSDGKSERSSVSGMSIDSFGGDYSVPFNKRSHEIAKEMLRSETAYVGQLHLLVRVMLTNLRILNTVVEGGVLPEEKLRVMFSNLEVIYSFHASNLRPQLEERLSNWWQENRLGDVMKACVPFLKLYLDYTENYRRASDLISEWQHKNATFSVLVKQIEGLPECRRLTIQQHLLNICQRPAHYQAILKDYCNSLENGSEEKSDITEALESLGATTMQLEKAMGKEERVKQLQNLQKQIDWAGNLVKSTRYLVARGRIYLISPVSGKPKEQYLFVFNDIVLLCNNPGINGKYKVKVDLKVDGMQVEETQNLSLPNTFHLRCKSKSLEFHTKTRQSKELWLECLNQAITEHIRWKLAGLPHPKSQKSEEAAKLGERAPTLVHLSATSMCMACGRRLSSKASKKHCMACGNVVCNKCSSSRLRLPYDVTKSSRVCDECYFILRIQTLQLNQNKWNTLNVKANEPAVIAGYLSVSSDKGRHWNKFWFSYREGAVLYSFRAHEDIAAVSTMTITGSQVRPTCKEDHINSPKAFLIAQGNTRHYFKCKDQGEMQKWVDAIKSHPAETVTSDC